MSDPGDQRHVDGIMKTAIVEISCLEMWQQISNYIDGDVEPELKARMEFHFQKCRDCKAVLDGTRNAVRLLTDGEWYPLPDGFGERLFQRLSSRYSSDGA
jgi:hypothetical protein